RSPGASPRATRPRRPLKEIRHTVGTTSRHLALSLVALLRRKNNKYNIYKEIQRFAGDKHTLCV
uniref:hypothetical protein n=1 Tax=Prevotella sp. TaxID=59823 RepID=UPI0040284AF4